jgi:hypothetical protein
LRQVDRGVMPDAVRMRKESLLMQDPVVALLQTPDAAWVDSFEAVPELHEFVQRDRIPLAYRAADSEIAGSALKPLSLNFWLQRRALDQSNISDGCATLEKAFSVG